MSQNVTFYRRIIDGMTDGVYFVDRDRTIVYWNQGATRLSGFPAEAVIGRGCREGILNHVDDSGRRLCSAGCPLTKTIATGAPQEAHVWMNHADGARRPVWVRSSPIRDDQGVITGAVEVFSDDSSTVDAQARVGELERLAMTDQLTGLGNRGYLQDQLANWCADRRRYNWLCGILFIDIDHFKAINDRYGHDVGDQVLALVGRTLSHTLPSTSIPTRFGGDEFVVLLPLVSQSSLETAAERLRIMVAASQMIAHGRHVAVTVSVGGTQIDRGDTPHLALRRADANLYQAKVSGRDRVVVASPPHRDRAQETAGPE